MNATVVIARRELAEKQFVLLAAIAFALLACLVPFVPGVHAGQKREAIVVVSTVLAVGFTLGLSTILGATIIGRDLSEGRLSFYFSRPIPAAAIWFGKLIAALVLIHTSSRRLYCSSRWCSSFSLTWSEHLSDHGPRGSPLISFALRSLPAQRTACAERCSMAWLSS
jgi:hypothetical protein